MSVRGTRAPRCLLSSEIQNQARYLASAASTEATRETARPKIVAAEKIVTYRTIRVGLGSDASNASIAVPAAQSDGEKTRRGALNQRQRRGGDKTKNRRHRENREIFHDAYGSWYWHGQLECRGSSRAVSSKFQERRLAGAETPLKDPRPHFNWRFFFCEEDFQEALVGSEHDSH